MDDLCRGRIEGDFLLTRRLRLRLFREVIMSSPGRVMWGCHGVVTWLTQANTNIDQRCIYCFLVFNIKNLYVLCFHYVYIL